MKEKYKNKKDTINLNGVKYVPLYTIPDKDDWPEYLLTITHNDVSWDERVVLNKTDKAKLGAVSTCLNTARGINGTWEPDYFDSTELKWYLFEDDEGKVKTISATNKLSCHGSIVVFHSEEAAKHFIKLCESVWLDAIK